VSFLAVTASTLKGAVVRTGDTDLLGLGFWSRHIVTFDFPNRVIYLRQGARFKEPDRYDLSGLHLLRINGATVVHSVDDGSPAANAGIRAKDVIVKINHQTTAKQRLFAIRRLLSVEGHEVAMTVKHGDEDFEVAFSLLRWGSSRDLGSKK
jgi:S1-C subfamily serine protease